MLNIDRVYFNECFIITDNHQCQTLHYYALNIMELIDYFVNIFKLRCKTKICLYKFRASSFNLIVDLTDLLCITFRIEILIHLVIFNAQ